MTIRNLTGMLPSIVFCETGCSLQLTESVPLQIKITSHSHFVVRRLFFNETKHPFSISIVNMTKHLQMQNDTILLPCATNGQYDLLLRGKRSSAVTVEVFGRHPSSNWKLQNETNPIRIRFQNRMQKKQMNIKWSRSKLDIHAMHYCIVINTRSPQPNFCSALQDSVNNKVRNVKNCMAPIESLWIRQKEWKIDPYATNVICTGLKPRQNITGLVPDLRYYIDIYGIHTKRQNLTILLKSTSTWFNRTHPDVLRDNAPLTLGKMSGVKRNREAIFSYKIPSLSPLKGKVRLLVIPCSGSQVDVNMLKRRKSFRNETDIYKPTYIAVPEAVAKDRLIFRVKPSNVDELLHANRVGISVSMTDLFESYPELPNNTSIFLSGSYRNCEPKIAWYPSKDKRKIRYCVIVFRLPNNSRNSMDETNYCLDFGKNVMDHPDFHERSCYTANQGAQIEQTSLLNLIPGDSYIVYVTVHLIRHNYLPYESLEVNIHRHCRNNTDDVSVRAI